MKAIEYYFPVVLFIVLYKVVLTLEFVDEICWQLNHTNESYRVMYFLLVLAVFLYFAKKIWD